MRYFNDYGIPYSDELYHYGILGQKWGVRRFQNLDRTWTEEGKIRYGGENHRVSEAIKKVARSSGRAVSSAAKAAGRGAKGAGKFAVKRFKMRHPWAMTDAEVKSFTERYASEKKMKDAMRDLRDSSFRGKAGKFIGDMLTRGAYTLSDAGFKKLAEELTKNPLDRKIEDLKRNTAILDEQKKQKKLIDDLLGKKESVADLAKRMRDNPESLSEDDWDKIGKVAKSAASGKNFVNNFFSGDNDSDSSGSGSSGSGKPVQKTNENAKQVTPETPVSRLSNLASQVQESSFLQENKEILDAARKRANEPTINSNRFSSYKMPSYDSDPLRPSATATSNRSDSDRVREPYNTSNSFGGGAINSFASSYTKALVDDSASIPMNQVSTWTYDWDEDRWDD